MRRIHFLVSIFVAVFTVSVLVTNPADAMDRRLGVMLKTSAVGAGAGFLIGAGTAALGLGGIKNAFMGASAGLYAGILFGGYLLLSHVPPEERMRQQGPRNPYAPREPVDRDEWQDSDEDDYRDMLPPERERESMMQRERRREIAVWAPIVTFAW